MAGLAGGDVSAVAWDLHKERMAVGTEDGSVQVCARETAAWASSTDGKLHRREVATEGSAWQPLCDSWRAHGGCVRQLCWAEPSAGPLLASCGEDGAVCIWEQEAPSRDGQDGARFKEVAKFTPTTDPIVDVKWAPAAPGRDLALAAGSDGGYVYVFEGCSAASDEGGKGAGWWPRRWSLAHLFSPGGGLGGARGHAVTSLSWRPATDDVEPMLAVGTTAGAQVWVHHVSALKWARSTSLALPPGPVTALSWAAPLARRSELLAVAVTTPPGAAVAVVGLEGESGELRATELQRMEHDAAVDGLEWDALGLDFVACLSGGRGLVLWEHDMGGRWRRKERTVDAALLDEMHRAQEAAMVE
ncbi:unnamed protein product [Pedinophyceae sp. YPF-701]|nr:unnamed protein product [Pedinophyceae sp. YPF-701]